MPWGRVLLLLGSTQTPGTEDFISLTDATFSRGMCCAAQAISADKRILRLAPRGLAQNDKTEIKLPNQTPLASGCQMNLWICRPRRTFRPSARIHSASCCGSRRQCEASRAPRASLRNAGEKITEFTRVV